MQGMLGFGNVLLSVSVLLTNEYKHVSLCWTFDLSVKPEFAVPPSFCYPHHNLASVTRTLSYTINKPLKELGSFGFSCCYLRNECR